MHINNKKLSFDIFTVGNLLNIFMEHDLYILIIFGITEKCIILTIQCIFEYCYKYTCAAHDCFCAPETHIINNIEVGKFFFYVFVSGLHLFYKKYCKYYYNLK